MSTTCRISAAALLVAAFLSPDLHAQNVPTTRLDRPSATFAEPMSAIRGLRELSDGRVVVSDMIESAVRVIDFRSGAQRDVGRQGEGPGEYGMPGELFSSTGDTTLMMDMGNRRFMVITPDGRMLDDGISVREAGGRIPVFPRAVDGRGNMYFDLAGIMAPGMRDIAMSGQAPLIRWNIHTKQSDTIAVLNFPPVPAARAGAGPGEVRVSIGGGGPYRPRDTWAVSDDGRVGIVRHTPYRVEWFAPGRPAVTGPEIAYRPVRIGQDEKEAWADAQTRGMMVVMENGRRRTMAPPRPDVNTQEWPEVMPPFTGNARITPQRELWIQRSRPASGQRELYVI